MGQVVIPNEKRRPNRRTGEIEPFLSRQAPDGRTLPIAVDESNERHLRTLRSFGTPQPVPAGLETTPFPGQAAA